MEWPIPSDIDMTHEGSELFPMYRLAIVGSDGEERKNYEPGNAYVLSVEQSENMLVLSRVTRTENGYEETTEDHIVSTNTDEEVATGTTTQASSVKGSEAHPAAWHDAERYDGADGKCEAAYRRCGIRDFHPDEQEPGKALLCLCGRKPGECLDDRCGGNPPSG